MKTILIFSASILIFSAVASAQAVSGNRYATVSDKATFTPGLVQNQVSMQVLRHFALSYPAASNVYWTAIADGGAVGTFSKDEIVYRCHYDHKGRWMYTVASYGPQSLDHAVKAQLRSAYVETEISHVDEITAPGESPFYLVQLQNEKLIQTVKVTKDGMELVNEFPKAN